MRYLPLAMFVLMLPGPASAQPGLELRVRASGYLEKLHVKEGHVVKKGELLLELNGIAQQTALQLAEAKVAAAEALFKQASADAARAERLYRVKAISQAEYDQIAIKKIQPELMLTAARLTREIALMQLERTRVHAPVAGRITRVLVKPGEFVKADETVLALIAADTAPVFEFKLRKPEDAIAVAKEKERTVFVVTSPSGIGNGTITLKAGQWTENVTVRFQHGDKKGFTSLEKLTLTTDRVVTEGSLRTAGQFPFRFLNAIGSPIAGEVNAKNAAGVLNVLVQVHNEGLEVTLPARLLIGSSRLEISWIDAFR